MKTYMEWIRTEFFPTAFCPGCGHGIILRAIAKACDELELDRDNVVFVSGIGCSGWIPSPYIKADSIHTTHGRAIAFATGVKLARPDFTVIVVGGDGDLASIGGNHLIHAARRNIDITCIMADNNNYGMTGGQYSPTTPKGSKTSTSRKGLSEAPFDVAKLVKSAGASFVARYTVAHFPQLVNSIKKAISTEGFSFVQAISTCPTHFGRRNVTQDPYEFIDYLKRNSVNIKNITSSAESMGKIIIGEF
jgi:2-oxoglutarate ferredoxin oxidoreductase subunit beta